MGAASPRRDGAPLEPTGSGFRRARRDWDPDFSTPALPRSLPAAVNRLFTSHGDVAFMRSIALLLLGAGLLWLVLRQPSASTDDGARASGVSAGVMLEPESPTPDDPTAPAGEPTSAAQSTEAPTASAAKPSALLRSEIAPPQPAPETTQVVPAGERAVASLRSRDDTRSAEIAVAERIVHSPDSVGEFLQQNPSGIPASRRELARVLASLSAGDQEAARRAAQGLDFDAGITSEEGDFVRRATSGHTVGLAEASARAASILVRATEMALSVREARARLDVGEASVAAKLVSEVVMDEFRAPWRMDSTAMRAWIELLRKAQSGHRWRKDGPWNGVDVKVEKGDSLISIRKRVVAQHPGVLVCTGQIARSNGLSGEVIHPGQTLRVPLDKARMLVDLDGHWAVYLVGDEVVDGWEVGVGKPGNETRAGEYRVGDKRRDPMWFPVGQAPVPFGDARNPLGTRWIEFETADGQPTHLGFHGTNEPNSVGGDTSQGCLRMRNGDVEQLFEILPQGAAVLVQP